MLAERIGDFVVYCTPDAKVSAISMQSPADIRNHLLLVHCEVHAPGGEFHIMRTLMPLPSGQQMHDKHRYNQRPDDMQPRVATQLAPE